MYVHFDSSGWNDALTKNAIMNELWIALVVGALIFVYFLYRSGKSVGGPQLVVCSTSHSRFFPVRHSFTYPLLYIFFRIDKPTTSSFFAVDKWRIFHVRSDDYLGAPPCGKTLMEKLRWHLEQHVFRPTERR